MARKSRIYYCEEIKQAGTVKELAIWLNLSEAQVRYYIKNPSLSKWHITKG